MTGKKTILPLLLIIATVPALRATDGSNRQSFQRMIVLENGRQKPMDTFARNLLKQFSGRSRLPGYDASTWLARVLFTPGQTLADRIFLISHPDIAPSLGIPGQGRQRCSFSQLGPGLDKLRTMAMQAAQLDENSRSPFENEIMRLYANVYIYYGLLNAFRQTMDAGSGRTEVHEGFTSILAIIPALGNETEKWFAPAEILAAAEGEAPVIRSELGHLTRAAKAFAAGRARDFSQSVTAFNRSVQSRLPRGSGSGKISLELLYNRIDPFFKAELAYALALLSLLLSLLRRGKILSKLTLAILATGWLLHTCGLIARMIIMNRPPVTNLYETFVFVAWTGVLLGCVLERYQKNSLGLAAGSFSGLLFLIIAGRYSLEGDTMGMLAAVLDSNLWLATHVVTISVGYAGCIIAGIIGHVYIGQQLFFPDAQDSRLRTARSLYAILAFGLFFTFTGTVMGGIWADQSWGRFWGWDPKENGALLIILWCAVLFHARLARMIGPLGMAAGSIGTIIAVVLAWFGVNLLGVGMHSYGFTSGAARGLLAFVIVELLYIGIAVPLIRKKDLQRKKV